MGRHRDTGAGTRPIVVAPGRTPRSHRRPAGAARARAVSLVAAGAVVGGVAMAGTTVSWVREATTPHPDDGQGGRPEAAAGSPATPEAPTTVDQGGATADPVPDDPPPSASAPSLWRPDGPGAFRPNPWNTVGTVPPVADRDEVAVHLSGRGQRSEIEPALPPVRNGDQHDVTFSVRLDGAFATSSRSRQMIARWENDGPGEAPLGLRVERGELLLHGGEGYPSGPRIFERSLGRAPVGEWTELRVRVHFSAHPGKGSVSVWRDGRCVVDRARPGGGTLYPGQQSYLKVGLHRDRAVPHASTVRFRQWHLEHGRSDPGTDGTPEPTRAEEPRSDSRTSARTSVIDSVRDAAGPTPTRPRDGSVSGGSERDTTSRSDRTTDRATNRADAYGRQDRSEPESRSDDRETDRHDTDRHDTDRHDTDDGDTGRRDSDRRDGGDRRDGRDRTSAEQRRDDSPQDSRQQRDDGDDGDDGSQRQASPDGGSSGDDDARDGDSGQRSTDR